MTEDRTTKKETAETVGVNANVSKPGDYTKFPSDSVLKKWECGRVAVNIMVILKRTGNEFRGLSYEEYKTERLKDGEYSDGEKPYFNKAIEHCKNAETASAFSPNWAC